MSALPTPDSGNAARIEVLYNHFQVRCADAVAASNLALATILAGVQAVQPGDVLTVLEAAERLQVSEDTIYSLCSSGKLQNKKVSTGPGRRPIIRIPLAALLAYLDESDAQAPKPPKRLGHIRIRE